LIEAAVIVTVQAELEAILGTGSTFDETSLNDVVSLYGLRKAMAVTSLACIRAG